MIQKKKKNVRADKRSDGQTIFFRTLPATAGGLKIKNKHIFSVDVFHKRELYNP